MSHDNNQPKLTANTLGIEAPTSKPHGTYHHGLSMPNILDLLSQPVGIKNIRVPASSFGKQRSNQDAPNPYWREGQSTVSGVAEFMLKRADEGQPQQWKRSLHYGNGHQIIVKYNGERTKVDVLHNGKRKTGFTVKGMESIDVLQNQSKHSAGQAWYLFDGDENRTYGVDNCPAFRCAQKFNSFQPKTQGYAQFEKALKQWLRDVRIASKL
tara:strand:- start:369 stop:1001 length:633 start_codon:yes stop_codon:yes gene_type:complete